MRADLKTKIEIHNFLKANMVVNEDGFARYLSGLNDEKCADKLGVTYAIVRKVRQEMFGNVRRTPGKGKSQELSDRITAIEEYLTSKNPNWRT